MRCGALVRSNNQMQVTEERTAEVCHYFPANRAGRREKYDTYLNSDGTARLGPLLGPTGTICRPSFTSNHDK